MNFYLACLFIRNTQEQNKTICPAKIVLVWIVQCSICYIRLFCHQPYHYSLRNTKIHISVISFSEIPKQIVDRYMPTRRNIIFVFNEYICDECSSSTNRTSYTFYGTFVCIFILNVAADKTSHFRAEWCMSWNGLVTIYLLSCLWQKIWIIFPNISIFCLAHSYDVALHRGCFIVSAKKKNTRDNTNMIGNRMKMRVNICVRRHCDNVVVLAS